MTDPTPSGSPLRAQLRVAMPFLDRASEAHWREIESQAQRASLPAGAFVCMAGDRCSGLPVVLSGSARVYTMGEGGREITLYRIGPGESCILTAGCLLHAREFPAFARTEAETEALIIPAGVFQRWLRESPDWTGYLLDLLSKRLADTITLVNEATFLPLGQRLAAHLLAAADEVDTLRVTHADLAAELGSAREVVSRALKRFKSEGLVEIERGAVRLRDRAALGRLARPD